MSRFDYVEFNAESAAQQAKAKKAAQALEAVIDGLSDSRAKSLALTKLEEVYMWIGKAVRDSQLSQG